MGLLLDLRIKPHDQITTLTMASLLFVCSFSTDRCTMCSVYSITLIKVYYYTDYNYVIFLLCCSITNNVILMIFISPCPFSDFRYLLDMSNIITDIRTDNRQEFKVDNQV